MSRLEKYPVNENGEMLQFHYSHKNKFVDNVVFYDIMKVTGLYSGRSAKGYTLEGTDTGRWYMFSADMLKIIQNHSIHTGNIIGYWEVCKRGQNYGLRYLGHEFPK